MTKKRDITDEIIASLKEVRALVRGPTTVNEVSMRLLVCGGRDFEDREFLFGKLDEVRAKYAIEVVIEGGARGADRLAREWASSRGVRLLSYPAEWDRLGRAAGPIRNQRMLTEGRPTHVIGFAGGKGTSDMLFRARQAGVMTFRLWPSTA